MSAEPTTAALTSEDRMTALIAYVLMLFGIVTGATALLALFIAVMSQKTASDVLRSHYDFIIQTFWVAFFSVAMVFALAGLWSFMGYAWLPSLGRLVFLLVSLWVVVRSVIGILRLGEGDGIAELRTLGIPARFNGGPQAA